LRHRQTDRQLSSRPARENNFQNEIEIVFLCLVRNEKFAKGKARPSSEHLWPPSNNLTNTKRENNKRCEDKSLALRHTFKCSSHNLCDRSFIRLREAHKERSRAGNFSHQRY
jgi:hypothetical protein